jgi:Tfp pilus assembly protein PilP
MSITVRIVALLAVCAAALPGRAEAQPAGGSQAPPAGEAPRADEPSPYGYEAEGRRDPFVSLVARGKDPRTASSRPPGVGGLLIGEVSVRGVVRDRTGYIAMIQGPDRKTFIVRAGEQLMDGSIKAITDDGIVFAQDVTDPLATVKQKEVHKSVRPLEGGRS